MSSLMEVEVKSLIERHLEPRFVGRLGIGPPVDGGTLSSNGSRERKIFSRIRKATAREVADLVKDQVQEIVAIEGRRRGGIGPAIIYVAGAIGSSSAWVRRVFDGRGDVSVHAHLMMNVEALLDEVIDREQRRIEANKSLLRSRHAAGAEDYGEDRTSDLVEGR